jgi:uncharacterized membrane protein
MNRSEFLNKLRGGLTGLPFETVNEIVGDYESHFTDGKDAGRSEAEVASALGDPTRLAKELRAEAGLKRWEEERNPSAAAGAVLAVLGLATIDVVFLLPILLAVGGILLGLFVGAVAIFIAGVAMLTGSISGRPVTPDAMTTSLASLGLMSLGIAIGALIIPAVVGLLNLLGRYGRLHYRLLQPALEDKA